MITFHQRKKDTKVTKTKDGVALSWEGFQPFEPFPKPKKYPKRKPNLEAAEKFFEKVKMKYNL
jgi:hypothetical protein